MSAIELNGLNCFEGAMRFVYITIFICLSFLTEAQPPEVLELTVHNNDARHIYSRVFSKNVTFSCALLENGPTDPTLNIWISDSCGLITNSAEINGDFFGASGIWKVDTTVSGDYVLVLSGYDNINLGKPIEFKNVMVIGKSLDIMRVLAGTHLLHSHKFHTQFDVFSNGIARHGYFNGQNENSITITNSLGDIRQQFQLEHIPGLHYTTNAIKVLESGDLLVSRHLEVSGRSSQTLVLLDTSRNKIKKVSEVPFSTNHPPGINDFITVWKSNIYVFSSHDEEIVVYQFNSELKLLKSQALGLPSGFDFAVDGDQVHIFGSGRARSSVKWLTSYAVWNFREEKITSAFRLPDYLKVNDFRHSLNVYSGRVFLHYSKQGVGVTAQLKPSSSCDSILTPIEIPEPNNLNLKSEIRPVDDYSLKTRSVASIDGFGFSKPSQWKLKVASTCPTDYFKKSLPVFDTVICKGVIGTLTSRSSIDLKWSTGDSGVSVKSDTSGLFVGRGVMGLCSVTDSQQLYVIDSVNLRLPADSSLCPGSDVSFYPSSQAYQLKWTFPNGINKVGYTYRVTKDGVHYVSAYGGGCKVFDSVDFHLYPVPDANAGNDTSVCIGDSIHLLVTGGQTYHWWPINEVNDPHIAQPLIHPKVDQWFLAEAMNQYGCSDSDSVHVKVFVKPRADFDMPRYVSMSVKNVELKNQSTDAQSFNWLVDANPISQDENPIYEFPDSGNYVVTLEVLGEGGCSDFIRQQIRIEPRPLIWVPNAFTPNDDGINDAFGANTFMIDQYSMTIFSKSGQLVWKSDFSSPYPVWNGNMDNMESEEAPTGVYVFIIKGFDDNGFPRAVEGKVHLIR